nr:unnamed protein product [Callosobruchus analis]
MTPYQNPNTPQERQGNSLLKRRRVCLVRCFGQLEQRFSILQYKSLLKLENIPKVIVYCIDLHNIAKPLRDPDFPLDDIEQNNNANNPIEDRKV